MRRFSLLLLAVSSIAWPSGAVAATRPHYGGTLRITMREAPQAADPASLVQAGASNISRLLFDTLVVLDDRGQPQPSLATAWESEAGSRRWRISLRPGVSFTDDSPLDATSVAASLRGSNPEWRVLASGGTVIIQTEAPDPELPIELALARNAISRAAGQQTVGTGPFSVSQWLPGKHLTALANDHYWSGRPFLDSLEVDFGRADRDQLTALDMGRTDFVEVAPENIRRARAEGRTVLVSGAGELLALVFFGPSQSEEEAHARNALALSLDTAAINNVLLQGGGEPAGTLLPNWLSGYAFVFPQPPDLDRARTERALAKKNTSFSLAYNAADSVAHTIAERILLNARDAGITLQLTGSGQGNLQLARIPIASLDGHVALAELAKALQLPAPKLENGSVNDLYSAEKALLQTRRVIPLLHLRSGVATRPTLHNFNLFPDGTWQLNNAWLGMEKP